jgi:hypothetical protein
MNISVPSSMKKRCYNKGVSLYDERTLEPKSTNRLLKNCDNETKRNENTLAYGVPPRPERARAVRKALPQLTVNEAIALADPFYSFENPMYLPGSPIPGRKNTLYYTIGHDVWTIVPDYFPGPSADAKRPPRQYKLPTAAQTLRQKNEDKKRDEKYKKKWGTTKGIPKRTTKGSAAQGSSKGGPKKKHFKK